MSHFKPSAPQAAIPGIIGGMGALAHVEFERRLIQKNLERGVVCDQDHPVWVLINAADVPDRTRSLLGEVEDCTPWLVRYGRLLEQAGVDFMIVTCNTSHAFYPSVQTQLTIPWMHLMEQTVQFIATTYPTLKRIGILATDGTLRTELYTRSLLRWGLTPIVPMLGSDMQMQVMQSIYHPNWGIKSTGIWIPDQALHQLRQAIEWLDQQGAELVIAGCTELSVALARMECLPLPWVDPLEVAAALTLDLAFGVRSVGSVWAA